MMTYDIVIRGGTVVTASDTMPCDIGIQDGKIAALGRPLQAAGSVIDADGMLVLPGGVDGHCHIEQMSSMGIMCADDFWTATVSAAFGGTTTVIPFAAQHRGQSLRRVVEDYHARAQGKAVIDYGFHLIVSDPTPQVLAQELPALIANGLPSFKIYMTYDLLKLDDYQMLDVLATARLHGALVMVHAENNDMIRWLSARLVERGHLEPKFHAISHPRLAEAEAVHRAIALSQLTDVPLLVVHVSTEEALTEIRRARAAGLKVYAETCPQYLFLTADDLDRDGVEGAKFCCSPPPRDQRAQEAMWSGLADGSFEIFSSDHAPYRFDQSGKLHMDPKPPFTKIANGVPGIELRLPLLFSEGVGKERIDINRFVALTATNVAKLYGLYPRKGTIAIGADADIAIWDPERRVTVSHDLLHDAVGYTPYEGRHLKGWPVTVLSRGRLLIKDATLQLSAGSGIFLHRELSPAARPLMRYEPELDPGNFRIDVLSSCDRQ